jgi:hypothetical protein
MLLPGGAALVEWQVANEPAAVKRLTRKIQRALPGAVRSCYEAGVCGYTLQRQLEAAKVPCTVIAPVALAAPSCSPGTPASFTAEGGGESRTRSREPTRLRRQRRPDRERSTPTACSHRSRANRRQIELCAPRLPRRLSWLRTATVPPAALSAASW